MADFSLGEAVLGTSVDLDGLKSGFGQAESLSKGGVERLTGALTTGLTAAVAGIGAAVAGAVAGFGVAAFQATEHPNRSELVNLAALVTLNSDTAFSSGSAITWDVELYDTANLHDNATNNTRLVAPATGIYIIHWTIRTQTIINPLIRVRLNGSTDIMSFRKGGTIAGDVNFAGVTGRSLVQNDYVELLLQFDTDPTRTVFHNPFSQFGVFSLIRW